MICGSLRADTQISPEYYGAERTVGVSAVFMT
ncbi:hypothetical protein ACVWVY_004120 [Bradyrhizobium sp. URHC0002]